MDYKTTDIVLAATLLCKQHKLKSIEVLGSRGTFVFQDIPDETLLDFDLSKSLVEPIEFNNNIKKLTTSVRRLAVK